MWQITTQPESEVVPVRFDDSAVALELRSWIENPLPPREWQPVRVAVHSVDSAFERTGVNIPRSGNSPSGEKVMLSGSPILIQLAPPIEHSQSTSRAGSTAERATR
ncbi:hypothetical protein [Haloplanus rubicundus]|uniref:hypothetical protein n=1 Tax=Haloplanus rubicundus TaxID=1547898 RepID=UPI0037434E95